MNERPEATIDVGEQRCGYEVHEPSRIRGLFLIAKELVEYRDASAGLQHTRGFFQAQLRLRHHRKNQVHDHGVERRVGECQVPGIHDVR